MDSLQAREGKSPATSLGSRSDDTMDADMAAVGTANAARALERWATASAIPSQTLEQGTPTRSRTNALDRRREFEELTLTLSRWEKELFGEHLTLVSHIPEVHTCTLYLI